MNKEGRPPNYTPEQFDEIWDLYKRGSKLWDIAQALDINPGSIHIVLHRHGGIAPYRRAIRQGHLSLDEREEISRGIAGGNSARAIARSLGRSASTISREIAEKRWPQPLPCDKGSEAGSV